jgi:hypothetical protein
LNILADVSESGETYLVGILERPAIKAIVAGVDTTLREPGDVAVFESSSADGGEGAVPVEQIGGSLYGSN